MLDTHNRFIDFGKHKGERWTRLPIGYLRWMANEFQGFPKEMAESELARRGTTIPSDVELSGHSIDRASQMTDEWKEIGVHSWLSKLASEAIKLVVTDEVVIYQGFKFVFKLGNHFPILKTVMKKNSNTKK